MVALLPATGFAKHLGVLATVGLVRGTRQGRERIWALEPSRLVDAHQCLGRISEQWGLALQRLKEFVEKDG